MAIKKQTYDIKDAPGGLPAAHIPDDVDTSVLADVVENILNSFSASHLTDDALWRDWFALTGGTRTFSSSQSIAKRWQALTTKHEAADFKASRSGRVMRVSPGCSWVDITYMFSLAPGGLPATGSGTVSLIPTTGGTWKIWMITTILESFNGHPNPDVCKVVNDSWELKNGNGTHDGNVNGNRDVKDKASSSANDGCTVANGAAADANSIYEVVIIGSGQHGLSLAGRLNALGISNVVLERNAQVGDNWRHRYDSVKLHTPTCMNELPFERTWGLDHPLYLPGWQVADGHQRYTERFNINVQTGTEVKGCDWDADAMEWTIQAVRAGSRILIKGRQVALAAGQGYGVPKWPSWPHKELYRGIMLHSSQYKNCHGWQGKKAVIVGTGTSAHDIARDMIAVGMDVTMVQRNRTAVFPLAWQEEKMMKIWNLNIPTEVADRAAAGIPNKILRDLSKAGNDKKRKLDQAHFDGLERAGFRTDQQTEFYDQVFDSLGGYYIDVGASAMVIDGRIKVKSGVPVINYTSAGLLFADGTELDADILCHATGFETGVDSLMDELFGSSVAANVGPFWGVDEEGELRGVLKHVGNVPLWLLGGSANQARWHSRFMALHVQASLLGKPLQRLDY